MTDMDLFTIEQTALNMMSAARATIRMSDRELTRYNWADVMDGVLLSDGKFHNMYVDKYDDGTVIAYVNNIDGEHTARIALFPEV